MTPAFQPLSTWQKRDCINRSSDYDCPNPATQEITFIDGSVSVYVRCCTDQPCMDRATELGRVQFDAFQKST